MYGSYGTAAYGTRTYGGLTYNVYVGTVIPYIDVIHHIEDVTVDIIEPSGQILNPTVQVIHISPTVAIQVTRQTEPSAITTVVNRQAEVVINPEDE